MMLISLIGRYCPDYPDLLRSKLYSEETFYTTFLKGLNKCRESVIIESPFMTTRRVSMLLPALIKLRKKAVKITINTRDPEESDNLRLDCHKALSLLMYEGIHVVFTKKLPRKIAIIDGTKLWEGSLNIFSQNNSKELMRRSISEKLCNEMISFTKS